VVVVHEFWRLGWCFGWLLVAGLMWAVVVVVVCVFGEDAVGVGRVHDQDVVENLTAQGADHSFAVSICCGCSGWCLQDVDVVCLEDGVERAGVFGVAVADGES
jgi:hypothetical protein